MRKIVFYITTVVLGMILSTSLYAKNYSVSTASDIKNLSGSLLPGDSIKMVSKIWYNQKIVLEGLGEENKPIVLIAENKDGVVLSGTSNLRINGKYLEVNGLRFEDGYSSSGAVIEFRDGSSKLASYCRLTNCTIKDYNPSNKDTDYKWVSIYSEYNRVDHCAFSGKKHSGTTLVVWLNDQPNYTQIDHNYFGSRPDLGYNGGETIRIGTSSNSMKESHAVVEYNVFEECDGEIEIISNKSGFNVYRYNTFTDCNGCLTLRHGNDCSVYSNFFVGKDKSSGGVRIIGERHQVYNNYFQGLKGDDYRSAICMMNGVPDSPLNRYFQVKNVLVVFNTIVDCKMPLIIGAGEDSEKSLAPIDCVFANNVIDKTTGSANVVIEDDPSNMTWLGNFVNANSQNEEVSTGFTFTNPTLQNSNGLWRPSSSSVLIDAAQGTYENVLVDIDGQERDTQKDVGCDEYSNAATLNSPLEKNDVGPYTEFPESVSGIFKPKSLERELVKCTVEGSNICFNVSESSYFPIKYSLYDTSGRVVKKGELYNSLSCIHVSDKNRMLLAYFVSRQQYYQSQKMLLGGNFLKYFK